MTGTQPGSYISLKTDNRYKDGNVKLVKGKLRGNKRTMALEHLVVPLAAQYDSFLTHAKLSLNPPIVVSYELGEAIKSMRYDHRN